MFTKIRDKIILFASSFLTNFFDKKNSFEKDILEDKNQLQIKLFIGILTIPVLFCFYYSGIKVGISHLLLSMLCVILGFLADKLPKIIFGINFDRPIIIMFIIIAGIARAYYLYLNVESIKDAFFLLYLIPIISIYLYINIKYNVVIKKNLQEFIDRNQFLKDTQAHFIGTKLHRKKEFKSIYFQQNVGDLFYITQFILIILIMIICTELQYKTILHLLTKPEEDLFYYFKNSSESNAISYLFSLFGYIFLSNLGRILFMDFFIDELIVKYCNSPTVKTVGSTCIKCARVAGALVCGSTVYHYGAVKSGFLPPVPLKAYEKVQLDTFGYYGNEQRDHIARNLVYFFKGKDAISIENDGKLDTDKHVKILEEWGQQMISKAIAKSVTEEIPSKTGEKISKFIFGEEQPPKNK